MKAIILLAIFLLAIKACLAKKELNFMRLAACPEFKNYTAMFKNVVFTKNKNGKTVSIRFEVQFKKEVKRMMVLVTLKKCDNSENLDSCEYYMKDFKINNACNIIGQKNQLWSEIISNSNFPRSCPIAAGTYKLNDTKLDDDMQLTLMPIPIALWKIKFFLYDSGNNDVMVLCSNLDVKVYSERRHL